MKVNKTKEIILQQYLNDAVICAIGKKRRRLSLPRPSQATDLDVMGSIRFKDCNFAEEVSRESDKPLATTMLASLGENSAPRVLKSGFLVKAKRAHSVFKKCPSFGVDSKTYPCFSEDPLCDAPSLVPAGSDLALHETKIVPQAIIGQLADPNVLMLKNYPNVSNSYVNRINHEAIVTSSSVTIDFDFER